jgi:hypothetical protein
MYKMRFSQKTLRAGRYYLIFMTFGEVQFTSCARHTLPFYYLSVQVSTSPNRY